MYQATEKIYEAIKETGKLKVFVDDGDVCDVWLQFTVENGAPYRIHFLVSDEDNDVSMRVFSLVKVEEEKRDNVIQVLNNLNVQYRYTKFVCDKDGDVNVEYDYPLTGSNPAESAEEMVIRFAQIVREAFPQIMRAVWA